MSSEEKLKKSKIKRQNILDAAIDEFQHYGYAMTSIDRIAEKAKVSKRTVYNHFKSKEDLFREILNCLLKSACAANTITYNNQPIKKQLKQFIKTQIGFFNKAETLKLARLVLVELIRSPELSQNAFKEFRDTENGLTNWLNQAKLAGKLTFANTKHTLTQLMGMIKTVAFWPQILENTPPLTDKERNLQAAIIADVFLNYYAKNEK